MQNGIGYPEEQKISSSNEITVFVVCVKKQLSDTLIGCKERQQITSSNETQPSYVHNTTSYWQSRTATRMDVLRQTTANVARHLSNPCEWNLFRGSYSQRARERRERGADCSFCFGGRSNRLIRNEN